jgi:heptosyltransferase-3
MRILVTKANVLGDTVSFLPTLVGIARSVPSAEVTLLCSPVGERVVRDCLPHLTFAVVDKKSVHSRRDAAPTLWRTARALSKQVFDVSLHSYDEPSFSYLLAAALRIPRRIGFDSSIARFPPLLTEKIPLDRSRNVVDINFDLVRRFTGHEDRTPRRVPLRYGPAEQARVAASLARCQVQPGAAFVAMHCGARLAYKRWDFERFHELASRVEKTLQLPVVLIDDHSGRSSTWKRLAHTPTVADLACLLDQAWMFVGNNSGPMQIAGAMGTPAVILQGPSSPNWEIFWSEVPHTIVKADRMECMPCESLDSVPGRCFNDTMPHGCLRILSVSQVELAIEALASSMTSAARTANG